MFVGGTRISIRMGIPVNKLGIGSEYAKAWQLEEDKYLMVDLCFPPHYFHTQNHGDIKVMVGHADDISMPTDLNMLKPCRLSWSVQKSIEKLIHSFPLCLEPTTFCLDTALDVCEVADVSFAVAVKALQANRNDKDATILMLGNQQAVKELAKTSSQTKHKQVAIQRSTPRTSRGTSKTAAIPPSAAPTGLISSFLALVDGKRGKGKTDPEPSTIYSTKGKPPTRDELHIMEICAVELEVAQAALESAQQNKDEACNLLLCEDTREELEAEVMKNISKLTGTASNASPCNATFGSNRADKELSDVLIQHNWLIRILLLFEERVLSCNKVCLICESKMEYVGNYHRN